MILDLKNSTHFRFPQGMIIFPGGVRQKLNLQRGEGFPFCELILENPEGRVGESQEKSFLWGEIDIFWNDDEMIMVMMREMMMITKIKMIPIMIPTCTCCLKECL